MSRRFRTILYGLFLIGFLVSAPIVVLYTAGYRYNFVTGKITQTGILSIASVPKGAVVGIDGVKTDIKTTAVVKNVLPGEHVISLEKEGYIPWKKMLAFQSRTTTFVSGVPLVLETSPELVVKGTIGEVAVDTHGRTAYVTMNGEWAEVWMEDTNSATQTLLARNPRTEGTTFEIAWSADGTNLELTTNDLVGKKETVLVNTATVESIRVSDLVRGATDGWWDTELDNRFFVATSSSLVALDLPRATTTKLKSTAEASISSGTEFILAETVGDRTVVSRTEGQNSSLLAYLPVGSYRFRSAPTGLLFLEDPKRGRIALVEAGGGDQPILLQANASFWAWRPFAPSAKLLYSDGFDIHVYDVSTHSDETLTRVSEPITSIAWDPIADGVLYAQNHGLFEIELDQRDGHTFTALTNTQNENIRGISVDARGRNAYFFGIVDEVEGLWRRGLRK